MAGLDVREAMLMPPGVVFDNGVELTTNIFARFLHFQKYLFKFFLNHNSSVILERESLQDIKKSVATNSCICYKKAPLLRT